MTPALTGDSGTPGKQRERRDYWTGGCRSIRGEEPDGIVVAAPASWRTRLGHPAGFCRISSASSSVSTRGRLTHLRSTHGWAIFRGPTVNW